MKIECRRRHEWLYAFKKWCEHRETVILLWMRTNKYYKLHYFYLALSRWSSHTFSFFLVPNVLIRYKKQTLVDTTQGSEEESSESLDGVLVKKDDKIKHHFWSANSTFSRVKLKSTLVCKFGQPQVVVSAHLDNFSSFPVLNVHNSDNILNYESAFRILSGFLKHFHVIWILASYQYFRTDTTTERKRIMVTLPCQKVLDGTQIFEL